MILSLKKNIKKKKYKIKVVQNLWQVNFRSNFKTASFLILEEGIIGRNFMKPRIKLDDINPLDLSIEKKYEDVWHYNSNKVKTILFLDLNIKYLEHDYEILNYVKRKIFGVKSRI
ncbi:hypothetical protein LCGC14_1246520 [marine sediment metagenome]|uniref:Uncharacterized protein n=1 Tax=marine sediment metagenome TaxID=412755 RepID=A0A0F9L4D6_9ZZZZ